MKSKIEIFAALFLSFLLGIAVWDRYIYTVNLEKFLINSTINNNCHDILKKKEMAEIKYAISLHGSRFEGTANINLSGSDCSIYEINQYLIKNGFIKEYESQTDNRISTRYSYIDDTKPFYIQWISLGYHAYVGYSIDGKFDNINIAVRK